MKKRRKAREAALQILYQKDMTGDWTPHIPEEYWEENPCDAEIMEFTAQLVQGTVKDLKKIDSLIEKSSENWLVSRMGVVDRNILRMAVHEMTAGYGVPVKVTLDEAIEISKRFGMEDSSKFINGVLNKIKEDMEEDNAQDRHRP